MKKGQFHLGADRYATVISVSHSPHVVSSDTIHIRIYDNNHLPTKKGVVLNASRWRHLTHQLGAISGLFGAAAAHTETIVPLIEHLGGGIFATMDGRYPVLHLRKYFKPNMTRGNDDAPIPTRLGVTLRLSEYQQLVSLIPAIENMSDELKNGTACY